MIELLTTLSQPAIVWGLFFASILLVLLDYLLPVDWLAYIGYVCFSLFVGGTVATTPVLSMILIPTVAAFMWGAHKLVFARFLTNAPAIELGGRSGSHDADGPAPEEAPADAS